MSTSFTLRTFFAVPYPLFPSIFSLSYSYWSDAVASYHVEPFTWHKCLQSSIVGCSNQRCHPSSGVEYMVWDCLPVLLKPSPLGSRWEFQSNHKPLLKYYHYNQVQYQEFDVKYQKLKTTLQVRVSLKATTPIVPNPIVTIIQLNLLSLNFVQLCNSFPRISTPYNW